MAPPPDRKALAALAPDQLAQLGDLSLDILTISGSEGVFTWVSPAFERVLGWSLEEATTRPYFEFLHPDDVQPTIEGLGAVLQGETVLDFENRYRHKDGSYRWLSWRCGPVSADGVLVATARDVTEPRAARTALHESEARHRALFEHSGDGIFVTDGEGRYLDANRAGCAMLGYTHAELLTLQVRDVLAPSELAESPPNLSAIGPDAPVTRIRRLRRKDGSELRAEIISKRLPDGLLQALARDLTERDRAAAALAESEARLRQMSGALPHAVAITRIADGQVMFANEAMAELVGMPIAELVGRRAPDFYVEPGARAGLLHALTAQGELSNHPVAIRRADGSVMQAAFYGRTISLDGEPALVASLVDLGERHRMAAELERSAAALREAQEIADVGSWDWDFATETARWSGQLYRIYGMDPAVSPTRELYYELMHPDDRERAMAEAAAALAARRSFTSEFRIVRRSDGRTRHVVMNARPIVRDGAVTGAVGTIMDVTSRVDLEAQFQQAQKMEAIGRFAGGLAHDFNNLLTVIQGCADELRARSSGDELDQIVAAVASAADVTRQLLAISRQAPVQLWVLDLNEAVREGARLLQRVIGDDITVELAPGSLAAWIRADRGQIQQVLLNLAVNARDAMPEGGTLSLRTGIDHEQVWLTVADTGQGMAPEVRARLFEPFFTTKEPGKGTGLGLASVFGIVSQWGGTIAVDSTPDSGTTFTLRIPAADAEPEPVRRRVSNGAGTTGRPATLLLVDDEPTIRDMVGRAMARAGFELLTAASGDEALALAAQRTEPIDLVISDVVMAGMSGPALVERLRTRQPDLPAVFISGRAPDLSGVDPDDVLLAKPFRSRDLIGLVRHRLAQT